MEAGFYTSGIFVVNMLARFYAFGEEISEPSQ